MSESERRALRAEALVAREEARDTLALLRAKAAGRERLVRDVHSLLARMRRDGAQMAAGARDSRQAIERRFEETKAALVLEDALALDDAIVAAINALSDAEKVTESLGLGR